MGASRSLLVLAIFASPLGGCASIGSALGFPAKAAPKWTPAAGDVPVVVTNQLAVPICELEIGPSPKEMPHVAGWDPLTEEWVGNDLEPLAQRVQLEPGHSLRVGLKPGTYGFEIVSCDKVYFHDMYKQWPITSATAIALVARGSRVAVPPPPPPSGFHMIEAELVIPSHSAPEGSSDHPSQPACLPDGARRDSTSLPFCCHKELGMGKGQQAHYCGPN